MLNLFSQELQGKAIQINQYLSYDLRKFIKENYLQK